MLVYAAIRLCAPKSNLQNHLSILFARASTLGDILSICDF
jgi:hypothetical protein